jgi:tetratricopeptide (TPR) repeat protein
MDPYFDLGSYSFAVTTSSTEAQIWFDRGLIWTYGYHHEEAIACFRRAIQADPACAMAHWGVAYASGPNYNYPWALQDDQTRSTALAQATDAMRTALALTDRVSPLEAALINALPARYPQSTPIPDLHIWDHDFANAMRDVHANFDTSPEVATIFAESLLNLNPWKMWDLTTGDPTSPATLECRRLLETALARPDALQHPGLLHLYIHLMEMSPTPEAALPAADALRTLVPDAGHLVHMPTHIDVLCGDYANVVAWNQRAVAADMKWYETRGGMDFYTGYRQHNLHFVLYGALFLGQYDPAMQAVRKLRATTPDDMLRIESPPMADFFEAFLGFEPHVLIRFGRWQQLIEMPLPDDPDLFRCLTTFTLYGKALAHAALNNVAEAIETEGIFLASAALVPATRLLHNNRVIDLIEVAKAMLRGEILYRQGDFDAAFAELRRSIALDDALPYDEPWGWMQPPRHALGALLFEQGHIAEAEDTYRADLGLNNTLSRASIHPDNVWSLKGLHDCLKARNDTAELPLIRQRLDLALARADTEVSASCFCAQAAMAPKCCASPS